MAKQFGRRPGGVQESVSPQRQSSPDLSPEAKQRNFDLLRGICQEDKPQFDDFREALDDWTAHQQGMRSHGGDMHGRPMSPEQIFARLNDALTSLGHRRISRIQDLP